MIADWSSLNKLTSPRGDLTLNAATGSRYLTLNERCDSGADLRVTFDNTPQGDGQLNHRQYLTGYKMRLALALWDDNTPACGQAAQEMLDDLGTHLDALRNPIGTARVIWTPEAMASRMVNEITLAEKPVVTVEPGGEEGIVTVTFAVVSRFPYEMSEAETVTTLNTGELPDETVVNLGTTQFWPVFKVYGPTASFTLTNNTTGDLLHYDGDQPGATMVGTSEYVEIDMFRGTAFLNGDEDNMLPGIDFFNSDFWALQAGSNNVEAIGAEVDMLWNSAWL